MAAYENNPSVMVRGVPLVAGKTSGDVEGTHGMLSFWGGYDPNTGLVIDRHHPLCGQSLKNKIVVMPRGKGSSTGSYVLLDSVMSKHAPAALILNKVDEIIVLGAYVCEEFYEQSLPIVLLNDKDFSLAVKAKKATIFEDGRVELVMEGGESK